MNADLGILAEPRDLFFLINLALAAASSVWLLKIFLKTPYHFVKPSMILLVYTHLLMQWPSVLLAHFVSGFLPDPYAAVCVVHGFVLLGLVTVSRAWNISAHQVWERIPVKPVFGSETRPVILTLCVILIAGVLVYLAFVPLSKTGLYVILTDPAASALAREESLKLLEASFPKYTYSLTVSAVVPLLCVFSAREPFFDCIARRKALLALLYAGLVCLTGLVASLTGARVGFINMVLLVALTWFWMRRFKINWWKVAALPALALLPAVLMSFLREGVETQDFGSLLLEYFGYIAQRAFITPYLMGICYIHNAQTEGLMGLVGIAKIAGLVGSTPLEVTNVIALKYGPLFFDTGLLETGTAPAGYFFTFYAYFGMLALPLSLAGLWLLDLAVPVYVQLHRALLLPTIVGITLIVLQFVQTDYTVVWITHGFGIILLLAYLVSRSPRLTEGSAQP